MTKIRIMRSWKKQEEKRAEAVMRLHQDIINGVNARVFDTYRLRALVDHRLRTRKLNQPLN